jgi:hypothetical protein
MKAVGWMIGASLVAWLIAARVTGERANPEVLYGMLGPLVVASVNWFVTERTYRANPERLTGVMVKGLGIKAVFFGAYVVGMLRVMELRAVPFVVSFTVFFIALHLLEAVFMQRLFRS